MSMVNSPAMPFQKSTLTPLSGRKVTIQEAIFEFGDQINELDALEMQVTYEDIELKVRFSDAHQMNNWKNNIRYIQGGKSLAAHSNSLA